MILLLTLVIGFLTVFQVGTPICVFTPSKDKSKNIIVHSLGRISSMQTSNGNQIFSARNGVVAIKVRVSAYISMIVVVTIAN